MNTVRPLKPLTLDAVIKHYHESCNAGISTNDAARIVLSESWIGFASRYNWKPAFETLNGSAQQQTPADMKMLILIMEIGNEF